MDTQKRINQEKLAEANASTTPASAMDTKCEISRSGSMADGKKPNDTQNGGKGLLIGLFKRAVGHESRPQKQKPAEPKAQVAASKKQSVSWLFRGKSLREELRQIDEFKTKQNSAKEEKEQMCTLHPQCESLDGSQPFNATLLSGLGETANAATNLKCKASACQRDDDGSPLACCGAVESSQVCNVRAGEAPPTGSESSVQVLSRIVESQGKADVQQEKVPSLRLNRDAPVDSWNRPRVLDSKESEVFRSKVQGDEDKAMDDLRATSTSGEDAAVRPDSVSQTHPQSGTRSVSEPDPEAISSKADVVEQTSAKAVVAEDTDQSMAVTSLEAPSTVEAEAYLEDSSIAIKKPSMRHISMESAPRCCDQCRTWCAAGF